MITSSSFISNLRQTLLLNNLHAVSSSSARRMDGCNYDKVTTALGDSKSSPVQCCCSLQPITSRWEGSQRMVIRVILWKVVARNCPALMNKITNFHITSVLRPMPATNTRISFWGLHCYTAFLLVPTTLHLEGLKGVILSIQFQPVEKCANLVFHQFLNKTSCLFIAFHHKIKKNY